MVFGAIIDIVSQLVLLIGLPLLIVMFYFEGLIVGKILQPPAVFVTVVAITRPSWPVLLGLAVGCTLAVVAGQWTTYRSFDENATELLGLRRRVPHLQRLPQQAVDRIGERRYQLVDRSFQTYGGPGVFVTTFIPGIRGLLAIPAGVSSYPTSRFLAVTVLANALYFPLLMGIAFGLMHILSTM